MTPAQLKVIHAARGWVAGLPTALPDSIDPDLLAMIQAVQELEKEVAAGIEQEIPWGQVCESDWIFSDRTKKWYHVISAVDMDNGHTKIEAKGLPKAIRPESDKVVRVKRGATGQAMDMWNVVWSAQTIPTIRESEEA